jgi:hypothetical protein
VEYIAVECQDPSERKEIEMQEKQWDDFTKLRKKLAKDVKQIREVTTIIHFF